MGIGRYDSHMASIGGWFVESFELEPDEEKIDSFAAIYHRGDQRPWGGRLYLTSERLIFVPNIIDRFRGGHSFDRDLLGVADVSRVTAGENLSASKLLQIEYDTRESERFHTKKLDTVRDTILEAIGDAAEGSQAA